MPVELPDLEKRYYTTGEVAKLFGVTRSTIRYWENRFDILRTHKFGNGERRFTADQVRLVQKIHALVKEKSYTIQGAVNEINDHKSWYREKDKVLERLKKLRSELADLKLQL